MDDPSPGCAAIMRRSLGSKAWTERCSAPAKFRVGRELLCGKHAERTAIGRIVFTERGVVGVYNPKPLTKEMF